MTLENAIPGAPIFNDDLLLGSTDQKRAHEEYPDYAFALDFEELRCLFKPIDEEASSAKARGRRVGLIALSLAALSWLVASAEPIYANVDPILKQILLLLSAGLGIAGITCGISGLLYSSSKANWLRLRFLSERLRQFHFQSMLLRLPNLVNAAENTDLRAAYSHDTSSRLKEFAQDYINHSKEQFEQCLKEQVGKMHWLLEPPATAEIAALQDHPYVARRIVDQLRHGLEPTAEDAELINGLPLIDEMRKATSSDDLEWIWKGISPNGDQRSALCVSLLRPYTQQRDVQLQLRSIWQDASPYMKTQLFWRILDDSGLPNEWHQELFAYVKNNWLTFQASSAKYLGPQPEQVIIRALERYGNQDFPESKKWAYLCSGAGAVATYPAAVKALINIGAQSNSGFTRAVADWLKHHLFARNFG